VIGRGDQVAMVTQPRTRLLFSEVGVALQRGKSASRKQAPNQHDSLEPIHYSLLCQRRLCLRACLEPHADVTTVVDAPS
jgi:hypothetical protein